MRAFLLAATLALCSAPAWPATSSYPSRKDVKEFVAEMTKKHGFSKRELNRVLGQAQFQPSIVRAMDQPPESALASWQAYRSIFIKPERIEAGVQFWNRNTGALKRAEAEFGVPEEEFLAALPALAMTAFEDLSNRTNPRMPLVSEITALLRLGYYGDTGLGQAPGPEDSDGHRDAQ